MMRNMKKGIAGANLMKEGHQDLQGVEAAVVRNIEACKQLTDVTRTSFGPNGMNKLIQNHLDKLFLTSDCSTIIKEMEIQHPAAKLVVLASQMQEAEIGDGSNFVVCLAGALLEKAETLIRMGLHPSEISSGYTKAGKLALDFLEKLVNKTVEPKEYCDPDVLKQCIVSSIAAKQYGNEDFIAGLVAKACLTVLPKNTYNFNVDNVRVCKMLGGDLLQSAVTRGMVLGRAPNGNVHSVEEAKIAVFTCSIAPPDTETKGTVLIETAEELTNFNKTEENEIEALIKSIADSGVKVVISGSSIDDLALHFIEKFGMMALCLPSKFELRRLCRAVGARPLVSLGPVSPEHQGFCQRVFVREVGLKKCTVFENGENDKSGIATILLRASTHNILNDVERAIDDGVNVVKAMGKYSPAQFVPGAGAAELELARLVAEEGAKASGLDQYAIKAFAEALEVVPRTLAENAGLNALDTISGLYSAHAKGHAAAGVDITAKRASEAIHLETKVQDLLATKRQALILCVDAVTTILRVDQIIMAKMAGGPRIPKPDGNHDGGDD